MFRKVTTQVPQDSDDTPMRHYRRLDGTVVRVTEAEFLPMRSFRGT